MKYKINKYGLQKATREEKEKGKLNRGKIIHEDSTDYAIRLLKKEINNNHIVLVSSGNKGLLKYIIDNKIKYCLVYAEMDLLNEYAERMKNRGNRTNFIEKMTNKGAWEQYYINSKNDTNATYKIELKSGQYLSDIKNLF